MRRLTSMPGYVAVWLLLMLLMLCACGDAADGLGGGGEAAGGAGGEGNAGGGSGGGGAPVDHPDVAVVPIPPSFVPVGDGSYRFDSGLEVFDVTAAFYADHGDDYDFIVIYTDFPIAEIWQYELTTNVDVGGIGQDIVYQDHFGWPLDWYIEAGSAGALDAVVFMNHRGLWDMAAFTAQEILTHEAGHRWGASMVLPFASDPLALLDGSKSHWARVAGVGGPSALGYGELHDNGDGTFTHERVSPLRYAPLELYAMGLIPSDDPSLDGLFYVSGAPGADEVNAGGPVSFAGTRNDLSIPEIAGALGPRTPPYGQAQTAFRFAFVLVCEPGPHRGEAACDDATVSWVDDERQAWETTFATATGGKASADTRL